MTPQTAGQGKHFILYDSDRLKGVNARWFDPDWYAQSASLRGAAKGRGTTHFVDLEGTRAVLRHYRRGGVVAKFNNDRYLRTGLTNSRPWREWHLLAHLWSLNLPVPVPVAAHVEMAGVWYRGDLLTQEIADAKPLSQHLLEEPLSPSSWQQVGATVRRFHLAGVFHADLNAHNILLNAAGEVFLIDFDRGRIREPSHAWQQANLARLQRSFGKLQRLNPGFHYDAEFWRQLQFGYSDAQPQ